MPRMRDALAAVIAKRLLPLAALLLAGGASLGSSVSFCESPDIYTSSHDLSYAFSDRWRRGNGADLSLWTPDGSRILFSHAGRIYVVDANGTELASLSGSYEPAGLSSKTAEIDFSPTLSPDGSRVAYSTLRYAEGGLWDHRYEIAIQPIDGSDRVRLTENDRDDIVPSWSPDGSLIAFMSPKARGEVGYREGYRVFAMSPDGSGEREIAPSVSALCCALMWSSDGGRLAFIGERRETGPLEWVDISGISDPPKREAKVMPDYEFRRQSIYTVKADGSGLVELAWSENPNSPPKTRVGSYELRAPEEGVSALRWSPDGERVAFVARRYGDKDGIYVADADGADVRRILDVADVEDCKSGVDYSLLEIRWSPDGSRIEFVAGRHSFRDDTGCRPAADAYSVSPNGSDLRALSARDIDHYYLRSREDVGGGSGPKRIVRYEERYNPNAAREMKERLLSTMPWDGSSETLLVKIVDGRLTSAEADRDADAVCGKAVPSGWWNRGLMNDCRTLLDMQDALAYDAIVRDSIFNWSGYYPISEWHGVTVEGRRVRALEHTLGMPLAGTIPPQIGELTELRLLRIRHDELEGEIPPELGNLSKLEVLFISGSQERSRLAGRIPPELGNLSKLELLYLNDNRLEGEIPAELGKLSKLKQLWLFDNELEGEVPPELGNLSKLDGLHLHGNKLTGCVPAKLQRVRRFDADIPFCE